MVVFLLEFEELKDLRLEHQVSKPKHVPDHVHNHNHKTSLHQLEFQYALLQIGQHDDHLPLSILHASACLDTKQGETCRYLSDG